MAPWLISDANALRVAVTVLAIDGIDGSGSGGSVPELQLGLQVSSDGFNWSSAAGADTSSIGVVSLEVASVVSAWARLSITIVNGADDENLREAYAVVVAKPSAASL